jgi:predicted metal-dependent HD superfamily phosphohydrolase
MRAAGTGLSGTIAPAMMDPSVTFERFGTACTVVGVVPETSEYRRLRRAWSGMGRYYHTLTHLGACLREFDGAASLAERPAEVELALWYHDAVYRTWRKDNETQSADWVARALRAAPIDSAERVRQMVLATAHVDEEFGGDTALVLDVDLAILGRSPDVYAQFERAIRREYWWVPRKRYVAGRARLLARFLERSTIYQHDLFYQRYETQARINIAAALEQLKFG